MRVLLTGSSGWLGRFLAPRLRADGHHVVGFDVAPGADTEVIGSVADRALVERAFADHGVDAVVHAAALHKPDIARYPAAAFAQVNVEGTRNLLEAASAAGCSRFVFTSTTSLMISEAVHSGALEAAVWFTERFAPLAPRNVYGASKLEAERVCERHQRETGLPVVVLRTGRFFHEEDDTHRDLSGPNRKANELLHRRMTVEDAAEAHVAALARAPEIGFGTFIVSAPPPFVPEECGELLRDAAAVVERHFPEAPALYRRAGWRLPERIDRVYDPSLAERMLGFRCRTDFAALLRALAGGDPSPLRHDPSYQSPRAPSAEPRPRPRIREGDGGGAGTRRR